MIYIKEIMLVKALFEYGYIRIATATPVIKVADIKFNTLKAKEAIDHCVNEGFRLILFPELNITGYTCADLFLQDSLLDSVTNSIDELATYTRKKKATIITGAPLPCNGKLFNCAVFISNGHILGVVPKTYLPNYNEYYEKRWFSSDLNRNCSTILLNGNEVPFGGDLLFRMEGYPDFQIGIEICEDLWSVIPPSSYMAAGGATLIMNLSAGNEVLGKSEYRRQLVVSQSARCIAAYVYCSAGFGESTTDLAFPGHNIIAENGRILAESERFSMKDQYTFAEVDINKLNLERLRNKTFSDTPVDKHFRRINFKLNDEIGGLKYRKYSRNPFVPEEQTDRTAVCSEIFSIQISALAKRLKHIGTEKVVIGLSGGLDSTLALIASVRTFDELGLKRKGIIAVTMPGLGTTKRTKNNAEALAKAFKVTLSEINISNSVKQHFRDINHPQDEYNIVYENAQARERTQILMDLANKYNAIVVGTGDLSELVLGWCTYNGDQMSMYGINSGIPKSLVRYIIEWYAVEQLRNANLTKNSDLIYSTLLDIINTPISPELLPPDKQGNIIQETEKTVGPYDLNDFFIYYVLRMNFSPKKVLYIADIVFNNEYNVKELKSHLINFYKRLFDSQFKRSSMPDGVKVGSVSVSPRGDLRMPSDAEVGVWIDKIKELDLKL
jgi:NAD+ synthase (glutamine-hydrolysing)